jgi:hypothetical protein
MPQPYEHKGLMPDPKPTTSKAELAHALTAERDRVRQLEFRNSQLVDALRRAYAFGCVVRRDHDS